MKKRIRLLLVDDHPVVRSGLRSCLRQRRRIQVVGEAGDGEEGVSKARELRPDVMLLDIVLPKMNGFEVAQVVMREQLDAKVLFFSILAGADLVGRAAKFGATGYVPKSAPTEVLLQGIETVADGKPFFPAEAAGTDQPRNNTNQGAPVEPLAPREREVLLLIALGRNNREIAHELGLAGREVQTNRSRIMRRLGIHTIAGLTRYAVVNGLAVPM